MSKKKDFLAVLCGAAVATFTFLVFIELGLLVKTASADLTQAQLPEAQYSVSTNVPSTAPYATTNTGYTTTSTINGANPATNAVPANTTNGAIWATPLDIRRFKHFAIEVMCNQKTNGVSTNSGISMFTNYLFLYASGDELRYKTNQPAWTSGPLIPTPGQTNDYEFTNIPSGIFDDCGYVFAGFGVQGTNSITNLLVRAIVKAGTFD